MFSPTRYTTVGLTDIFGAGEKVDWRLEEEGQDGRRDHERSDVNGVEGRDRDECGDGGEEVRCQFSWSRLRKGVSDVGGRRVSGGAGERREGGRGISLIVRGTVNERWGCRRVSWEGRTWGSGRKNAVKEEVRTMNSHKMKRVGEGGVVQGPVLR